MSDTINLINCAKFYTGEPHQDKALNWFEQSTGADKRATFAGLYRNGSGNTSPISFVNACKYYKGLGYQDQAFEWLELATVAATLAEFTRLWRSAPKAAATSGKKGTSDRGIALIKEFEGCVLNAYPDPGTGGEPITIGYGTTGPDIHMGMRITLEQAEALLRRDLKRFENRVNSLVKVPLSQNQFDALVSFDYNTGSLDSSTLLKVLNRGDYQGAADQFMRWVNAGGQVLSGLVRRRSAERALFLG